ncbi:RepB family plasmid replication initiator protein [Caballeronia sp. M23-90]
MRWISKAEYPEGLGYVEMRFAADLVPLLMNLRRQFTSYTLSQKSALRSVYSWRLLELLSQYESTGWLHTSVEDFGFAMDATPKQKENFAKIKSQIIEPAIRELTSKDGWLISCKPIKEGRRVVSLRFDFRRNPQGSLPL